MRILVDVDDTLSASQKVFIEHVNATHGTNYVHEEMTRAHREKNIEPWAFAMQGILKEPQVVLAAEPFEDALDAMCTLEECGHEIHIVSSRKEPLHHATHQWLVDHGFIDFVHEIHSRPSAEDGNTFKVRTAVEQDLRVAFDDTYEVAVALASVCDTVYLIDQPWNRGDGCEDLPPNVRRVDSFAAGVWDFTAHLEYKTTIDKPIVAGTRLSRPKWEIWSEGYAATGERAGAQLMCAAAPGDTFQEACDRAFGGDQNYNPQRRTYWGCKLYPDERRARRSYG